MRVLITGAHGFIGTHLTRALLAGAKDLDLLVYGHSHVATLEQMENGRIFGNAGSWLDAPTFLKLTDEAVELREWDGSAQGKCLDSVNR